MTERCPECGNAYPGMDHLVDHLTDDHDAYSWVTRGRPVDFGGEAAGE